jgi:hypothetical protein
MKQKVACHAGKCWEVKEAKTNYFEDVFEDNNIVDNIEKDLWKKTAYGN